ncbi:hypothetical protein ID866_12088 [Astraeus odoratus]|nr:hypothetical protein ID866_12088 [Astraeus odoratus]
MKILAQVADALHYFHQKQLCHGDLTGNNVLIDRRGDALISDFGLSFILAEANTTSYFKSCRAGAVRFIAPEVIRAAQEDSGPPKGTHKSDIYSYGCLILQVLTGEVPYHRYRTEYLVQAAKMRGEPPECLTTFHSSLSNVVRFMQTCWANEPQERPELTSIKSLLARLAPQPAQQRHRR